MVSLRLLADDLTGALDTAAEFVRLTGPVPVFWAGSAPAQLPASAAVDSGTRELALDEAARQTGDLGRALAEAGIAYKKVDSLLRGHTMAELAACLADGSFPVCIVAPAFPFQGRVTRDGVQLRRNQDGGWDTVADIHDLLRKAGLRPSRGNLNQPLTPGVVVFDAETDDDLRRIAEFGRAAGQRVLWCGSAGLAQALAGSADEPDRSVQRPVLGLFGSDQRVTAAQLAACGPAHLKLAEGGADSAAKVGAQLGETGVALVSLDLPPGLGRAEAADRIGRELARLAHNLPRPGTLIVAGGETLRGLCVALGATALEAVGQIEPGLPRSVMRGGRWDGVTVISKSGAFGHESLWRDLLDLNIPHLKEATR